MEGAVCIISYNRPNELRRLLSCLQRMEDKPQNRLDLIISIDHSSAQEEILIIAKDFRWILGTKKIVQHKVNLGLKKHVLSCASMVNSYDFIVLLEEDLIISPFFMDFLKPALLCAEKDPNRIGGISLYAYGKNENNKLPFIPMIDAYDNYFMQFAASWGWCVTRQQWEAFSNWLSENDGDFFSDNSVPTYVCKWSRSSWKKHFVRFLVREGKFFLYPRHSLVTNPGIDGEHHNNIGSLYSVPIVLAKRNWSLGDFVASRGIYDATFSHIESERLELDDFFDGGFSLGTLFQRKKHRYLATHYFVTFKELMALNSYLLIIFLRKIFRKIERILRVR